MGTISNTDLLTILDSLAAAKLIFDAGIGTSSSQANTVAKAAANDLSTLALISDTDVQADLSAAFRARGDGVLASSLYGTLGAFNIWWALNAHVGGNLDGYMETNNLRANIGVQTLGFPLSAQQIMPPATTMATFDVTGSGAGTYTSVADIDTSIYGPAWLEAVVTSTIGAAAITATVSGLQFDGQTPVSLDVTIAANSSVGTTVNIGTLGTLADSYDSVTGISITGGTAGDAFTVSSRVERTITATS